MHLLPKTSMHRKLWRPSRKWKTRKNLSTNEAHFGANTPFRALEIDAPPLPGPRQLYLPIGYQVQSLQCLRILGKDCHVNLDSCILKVWRGRMAEEAHAKIHFNC